MSISLIYSVDLTYFCNCFDQSYIFLLKRFNHFFLLLSRISINSYYDIFVWEGRIFKKTT
jgi:hypothetical protein